MMEVSSAQLSTNRVAEIATLMGEPARTAMLMVLADGRALTAGELSKAAGITPQTASGHLSKMTEAGLLKVRASGRHRYFCIPSKAVAETLEGLFGLATETVKVLAPRTGPRDASMVRARSCYDHIGGRLGVALAESMLERQWIDFQDSAGQVTEAGITALEAAGIHAPEDGKACALCRPCLDWSERRDHIAGPLGKGLMHFLMEAGHVKRVRDTRCLTVTPPGEAALWDLFGIRWQDLA